MSQLHQYHWSWFCESLFYIYVYMCISYNMSLCTCMYVCVCICGKKCWQTSAFYSFFFLAENKNCGAGWEDDQTADCESKFPFILYWEKFDLSYFLCLKSDMLKWVYLSYKHHLGNVLCLIVFHLFSGTLLDRSDSGL